MTYPKIVEDSHYHLWTDALHGRALAHQAKNRWDRGTYVRWTIMTAWTVLEMACEAALETPGIDRRFRDNLDAACTAKGVTPIDWGSGVWQRVQIVHQARKGFIHVNTTQEKLFQLSKMLIVRSRSYEMPLPIFMSASAKCPPDWLQEDDDKGWDRGSQTMAHMQVVHAGADPKGDETVRISYEYKDREFESDLCPAGTAPEPLADQLLQNLRIPVTAVRAYRGTTLIYERKVKMRGT